MIATMKSLPNFLATLCSICNTSYYRPDVVGEMRVIGVDSDTKKLTDSKAVSIVKFLSLQMQGP